MENTKTIKLDPKESEKINEILKRFGDMLVKHAKETKPVKKAAGGFIDSPLYLAQPNEVDEIFSTVRARLEEGGIVDDFSGLDEEGQIKYFISLLSPPTDSYQAYMLEQLEQDLARFQKTRAK
jgi:hypothetical protein